MSKELVMKKILVLALLGLLMLGGREYYNSIKSGESGEMEQIENKEESVKDGMEASWWELSGVLTADLADVSGGASTGTGYLVRDAGPLKHRVEANLPFPDGDNFYEGWLVKKSPTLEFFSTGEMMEMGEGHYSLDYSSDQEYLGYDEVVITLETKRDAIPEKHILEGVLVAN
jgi:hypothetical protein